MQIIVDIIVPVFGIVFIAYVAAASGLFSEAATRGLSQFVFNFAIPPMLFRTMATQTLPDPIEWAYLISFFGGGYVAWAIGMAISGGVFRRNMAEASIAGMTGAFGNTVLLGIPLILTTYGEAATLPIFLIIAFHSWQLFAVVTILIEGGRGTPGQMLQIPLNILKGLAGNPIIIGLLLGLVWNIWSLPIPKPVDVIAETLGKAALPCAVFAMGASLAGYKLRGAIGRASAGVMLKLLIHPAVTWMLATWVFQLEPLWRDVAVIMAALPVGVNVYLFAQRYDAGQAPAATAMLLSTGLSVVTITILLGLLGAR